MSVGHFDTRHVMDFSNMFRSCEQLAWVDTVLFSVSEKADITDAFKLCSSLSAEYKTLGEMKDSVS